MHLEKPKSNGGGLRIRRRVGLSGCCFLLDWEAKMLQKAVSYRNRPEVCRQMADDFLDESRKRVLESIADDYERMAAEIEKILKAQSAKPI